MSTLQLYIDDLLAECRNLDDLSFDYVSADGNPNAVLIDELVLELQKLGFNEMNDGLNIIKNAIAADGLLKKRKVELVDSVSGVIFSGLGDISQSRLTRDVVFLKAENTIVPFTKQANGFSLRSLWASELLTTDIVGGDVNRINYVINRPAAGGAEAATMALFGLTVTTQIIAIVKNITDGAFSTVAFQPWFAISTALQIVAVGIAIITTMIELFDLLIDRIRQYYCVRVLPLLEKGCAELGFTFDSSLFTSDDWRRAHILGETGDEGSKSTGTPTNIPVPDWTLGELIAEVEKMFHAKTKVSGTTVTLEPSEYFYQNPSNFEIQKTQNNTSEATPTNTYNTSELAKSYKIQFAKDGFEYNTASDYYGNNVTASFSSAGNALDNLSARKDVDIRFARGYRRETQTKTESLFNAISDEFNDLFAGTTPQFGDRIGMLELDGHFVGTPKIFILNESRGRIRPESDDVINALSLWNNYHEKHESPTGAWSRWTVIEGLAPQPICSGDGGSAQVILAQLRENNVCLDYEGRTAVIEAQVYSTQSKMYEFRYRVQGWVNPLADGADIPVGNISTVLITTIKED